MSEPEKVEIPESEVPRPKQLVEPFAALKERLRAQGIDLDARDEPGEEWDSHRQHELDYRRHADGQLRYEEITDCAGVLRVLGRHGLIVALECDACGFQTSVRMAPERAKEELLERSGVPELFRGKEFDKHVAEQQPTLQACREWIRGFKRGPLPAVALWGSAGRGKSHLLCLMVETLIKLHAVEAVYRTMKPLMEELRTAAREGSLESVMGRLANVPVLALDDLGSERFTDAAREWFESLLDHRIGRQLPLIVATNYPPPVWDEAFGERAASRLRGLCLPFHLEGPDRRAGGIQQSLSLVA